MFLQERLWKSPPSSAMPQAKSPSLARGAFLGEGLGRGAHWVPNLFHCWSRIAGELFQIVLQQADLDAPAAGVLRLGGLVGAHGSVAHAHQIDPVNRDL